MTAIMNKPALAKASAYLRVNHRTKAAEVVHGAQVDYVLTEIYDDQQVKQQPGGGFVVVYETEPEDGEEPERNVVQYVPLAVQQDMRSMADAYKHWAAPGDGKQFHQQQDMPGKALSVFVRRVPGRCYVTRAGEIAHLDGGRIRNQFKPLTADDMAKAA